MAGGRQVDVEVAREEGQQAHGGEFGRADRKGAHGQREKDERGVRLVGLAAHDKLHAAMQNDGSPPDGPSDSDGQGCIRMRFLQLATHLVQRGIE